MSFRKWLLENIYFRGDAGVGVDQILVELESRLPKEKIRPESGPNRNGTSQAVRRAYNNALKEVRKALGLGEKP